jgi:hypothetical protein
MFEEEAVSTANTYAEWRAHRALGSHCRAAVSRQSEICCLRNFMGSAIVVTLEEVVKIVYVEKNEN